MAEDIQFDKTLDLVPGHAEECAPGVRRILCNNPSPFTFKGTMSYIVGRGKVAIIDPGPNDPSHPSGPAGDRGPLGGTPANTLLVIEKPIWAAKADKITY